MPNSSIAHRRGRRRRDRGRIRWPLRRPLAARAGLHPAGLRVGEQRRAAPGSGTGTRERAATSRAWPTSTPSARNWSTSGPGASGMQPSRRSSPTPSGWLTASTCVAHITFNTRVTQRRVRRGRLAVDGPDRRRQRHPCPVRGRGVRLDLGRFVATVRRRRKTSPARSTIRGSGPRRASTSPGSGWPSSVLDRRRRN